MGAIKAIGLMSGTSLDGVDVALIETDGNAIAAFGPTGYRPYSDAERALLRQALAEGVALPTAGRGRGCWPRRTGSSPTCTPRRSKTSSRPSTSTSREVAIVGFHGQTVILQAGGPADRADRRWPALAKRLGMPVAYDFRAADVAAGGQGAPLVPVFHQALARDLARPHPMAVLNLGGVANVTFVDGGDPVACDTGPGNALIDDFMRARTGAPYDNHGDAAADRQGGLSVHRQRARRSVLRSRAAEVARPQCICFRQYRPAGLFGGRRRGDPCRR